MTLSKGSTFKLLIVAFVLFVVFKPEKSRQMYEQVISQINQSNEPPAELSKFVETRLKNEIDRANSILDENEKVFKSSPNPTPVAECKCGGTGEIVHGDGHKTPCTCDAPCKCEKPKSVFGEQEKLDLEDFIEKAVQKSFDKYVKDYREKAAAAAAAQQTQPVQATEQMPQ